jgi:Protein of unknown function (DUF3011)/Peptidase inhibitor family I36
MKFYSDLRLAGLIAALLIFPSLAAAQDSIKCESNDGRRNYCGSYDYRQVQLERQISGSPCVSGRSWGVDDRGLWVDNGCRAYFTVRTRWHRDGYERHGDDNNGYQESIRCESNDGRRNYCGNYDYNRVRLDRQISDSPCVNGRSWGVDDRGLWVDNGCRALFTVEGRSRHEGSGDRGEHGGAYGDYSNNGWWDPDPNDSWPPRGESGGACFYQDREFRGSYFCMRRGEQREELGGYGDQISSIRTFGGVRVTIYDDRNFSGARETVAGDQPELQRLRVSQKPGHTWNNRISSIRIQ